MTSSRLSCVTLSSLCVMLKQFTLHGLVERGLVDISIRICDLHIVGMRLWIDRANQQDKLFFLFFLQR